MEELTEISQAGFQNQKHYMTWCEAAYDTAKSINASPTWVMQASEDFFVLYGMIPNKNWKQVLRAMYAADVLHAQDMGTPVSYRGWLTLEDAVHPAITKDIIHKLRQE
jgi:hypothetical protein